MDLELEKPQLELSISGQITSQPADKKKRPHCPQAKPEMQNYTVSVVRGSPVPV